MTLRAGFWLQFGSQRGDRLVELADELGADATRPGIVFAPVAAPDRLRRLYDSARGSGPAVVDPSGFLIDRDPSRQRAERYPWLEPSFGRPTDEEEWAAWMERGLRHQLSRDLRGSARRPSILITPSPQLSSASGRDEMYTALDAAAAARDAGAGGRECWLGLVVDRDYLRIEQRLTELANAVVSAPFPGVVLRCFQTELAPVQDRALLEGLREFVEACAGADLGVFLPNAGWLGWLAMAWGATGFSGGLPKSSWYDRMPAPMANVPRRPSIFEHKLLRHVPWPVHDSLRELDDYEPCECRSCEQMAGAHDADAVKDHQIRCAHASGERLRGQNLAARRREIRSRLDDAISFRDDLPVRLRERADAGFLDRWRSLV